jgi:hypothetical protein
MKDTPAIKLPVGDVPAKACMAIKQMTGLSLAEIRHRAAQDVYLFVCDYVDDEGLKLINGMRREMKKYGIAVRQFEDGVERPPELFDNIESMHDEINRGYR